MWLLRGDLDLFNGSTRTSGEQSTRTADADVVFTDGVCNTQWIRILFVTIDLVGCCSSPIVSLFKRDTYR